MEAKRVCHPLPPVYDQDSRVLFLGTMPSPKSRETGFYYAHPRNRFWTVLARILEEPVPAGTAQRQGILPSASHRLMGCTSFLRDIRRFGWQHPRAKGESGRKDFAICSR